MVGYSQAHQDIFVVLMTNGKKNGWYIEIGSNQPIDINNTYLLEKEYEWRGLMIEWDSQYLSAYNTHRPLAFPLICDATTIDYNQYLKEYNFPSNIDYLQFDLEVMNRSTLTTLEIFDQTVFDKYKFGLVTFEHDIYTGDHFNTRKISRDIFDKHGYIRIFADVSVFEDWYAHPDLIDNNLIDKILKHPENKEGIEHFDCIKLIESVKN
jgi:hypothetical protein